MNTCSTHRYAYIDRILYSIRRGRACGVMLFIAIRTSELATISAEAEDTIEIFLFGTVYNLVKIFRKFDGGGYWTLGQGFPTSKN